MIASLIAFAWGAAAYAGESDEALVAGAAVEFDNSAAGSQATGVAARSGLKGMRQAGVISSTKAKGRAVAQPSAKCSSQGPSNKALRLWKSLAWAGVTTAVIGGATAVGLVIATLVTGNVNLAAFGLGITLGSMLSLFISTVATIQAKKLQ